MSDEDVVLDDIGVVDCPHCGEEVTLRARAVATADPGMGISVAVDIDVDNGVEEVEQ